MTLETINAALNDLAKYQPAEPIAKKYPHLFTLWGLKREGKARDYNGMAEAGACIIYKHKMLFHEDRLLDWFEKRYARQSA